MIISHKYRYLFVELPLTGSTAISRELRENYDGQWILKKHSTYQDFLREAKPEEKTYRVFSGIRNPLDQAVSHYFKFKTDHRGQYTAMAQKKNHKGLHDFLVDKVRLQRFSYIQGGEADFKSFFLRFYRRPYSNWSVLSHRDFAYVVRFEHLAEDFAQVLKALEIDAVRPLPVANKTSEKGNFLDYYTDPEVRERAKWVFSPFMKYWGYEFPEDWGDCSVTPLQDAYYQTLTGFRSFYWRNLRGRI